MRPSTMETLRRAWTSPPRQPFRSRNSSSRIAPRRRTWANLSWRTSILCFTVPLVLLLASLIFFQRDAAPESLTLRVTDQFTGVPLTGATVDVGGRALTTNDRGEVAVQPGDGPLALTVRHDRYAQASESTTAAGGQLAVALRPTSVEGRITDAASGTPLKGATVSALSDASDGLPTTTGNQGEFVLTDVPAGARLRVEAGDYGIMEESIGERTKIDLAMTLSVLTGSVRDQAGAAVAGAAIAAPDGTVLGTTEADGSFRITGADLPEVVVKAPGFSDQPLAISSGSAVEATLQRELIKSIYANFGVLGDPERFARLIAIADETEVNAIVVDVKQDTIYYDSQVPFFRDVPGMVTAELDLPGILQSLDEHGIYSIARMVVFKDPVVAEGRPDLAVGNEIEGGLWRDDNGAAWVNAFEEELWRANADLAVELANLGFDEIQYDYIRFPSDGDLRPADFGQQYTEEARRAAITGAVAMGAEAVRPTGARFAVDLFPIIALFGNDQGIGQTLQDLVPLVDSINLMIYPSHYEVGNIPVDGHPNDFPAETVAYTLEQAEALVPGSMAKMRPWLQDFTYPLEGYSAYGPAEVRAQIDAAEAAGASGWLLWNAAGEFEVDALDPE